MDVAFPRLSDGIHLQWYCSWSWRFHRHFRRF